MLFSILMGFYRVPLKLILIRLFHIHIMSHNRLQVSRSL